MRIQRINFLGSIARDKFLDQLLEKNESIDNIENYDLIDFNINSL